MKKLQGYYVQNLITGILWATIGGVFGFAFLAVALRKMATSTGSSAGTAIGLLFSVGFLAVMIKGISIMCWSIRCKKYNTLIFDCQITSISELAERTQKKEIFVSKNLKKMIQKRYLTNVSLNLQTGDIILGGQALPNIQTSPQARSTLLARPLVCQKCGANTTSHTSFDCESCGSMLVQSEKGLNIRLLSSGPQKIAVIKLIKEFTNVGLREAKDFSDSGGLLLLAKEITMPEAQEMYEALLNVGASVEL